MNTARRAAEIQPFEVMDVLSRAHALEAQGRHVVHMEIGEPDFTAPEPVVEAGVRALREGRTAYTATLGLPALREAIAVHYASRFRASVPVERVVITSGASGGLLTVAALYFEDKVRKTAGLIRDSGRAAAEIMLADRPRKPAELINLLCRIVFR